MTEQEMLEAEKYWCENCCNWDKEEVQMDACSTCKLTGTRVFAQESGKECKCFNVPAENVIVPPCKVGDKVYWIDNEKIKSCEVFEISIHSDGILIHTGIQFCLKPEAVFLTPEEAEQALKGGAEQ